MSALTKFIATLTLLSIALPSIALTQGESCDPEIDQTCLSTGNGSETEGSGELEVITPVSLYKISDLRFPTSIAGSNIDPVVTVNDPKSAEFYINGEPGNNIRIGVKFDSVYMYQDDGTGTIKVDNWTYGGGIDSSGRGVIDASGNLNNIRVGATAHVEANDPPGIYRGSATLTVVYE